MSVSYLLLVVSCVVILCTILNLLSHVPLFQDKDTPQPNAPKVYPTIEELDSIVYVRMQRMIKWVNQPTYCAHSTVDEILQTIREEGL